MSNVNTTSGLFDLPKYILTDTNEHALIVPTTGTGVPTGSSWTYQYYATAFAGNGTNIYPGFPSPQFPNNSGLCIAPSPDLLGSNAWDGRPFKIKIAGVIANPGGGNLNIRQYQVPLASLGTISATGSVTTGGAPGSGDTVFSNIAFTAPANPSHFWLEYVMIWDSSTNRLDGYSQGQVQNTVLAPAATTAITSGLTAITGLNFMPSFQFSVSNAGNAVTLLDFTLDRF